MVELTVPVMFNLPKIVSETKGILVDVTGILIMRVLYNSSIGVFQTSGTGAAPVIRSRTQIGPAAKQEHFLTHKKVGSSTSYPKVW